LLVHGWLSCGRSPVALSRNLLGRAACTGFKDPHPSIFSPTAYTTHRKKTRAFFVDPLAIESNLAYRRLSKTSLFQRRGERTFLSIARPCTCRPGVDQHAPATAKGRFRSRATEAGPFRCVAGVCSLKQEIAPAAQDQLRTENCANSHRFRIH